MARLKRSDGIARISNYNAAVAIITRLSHGTAIGGSDNPRRFLGPEIADRGRRTSLFSFRFALAVQFFDHRVNEHAYFGRQAAVAWVKCVRLDAAC